MEATSTKFVKDGLGCLLVLLIVSPCLLLAWWESNENQKRYDQNAAKCEKFGQGKIIDLYSFRTGIKQANFAYHHRAVLENSSRERIEAVVTEGQCAVVGDVWTISPKFGENGIYLGRRILESR